MMWANIELKWLNLADPSQSQNVAKYSLTK